MCSEVWLFPLIVVCCGFSELSKCVWVLCSIGFRSTWPAWIIAVNDFSVHDIWLYFMSAQKFCANSCVTCLFPCLKGWLMDHPRAGFGLTLLTPATKCLHKKLSAFLFGFLVRHLACKSVLLLSVLDGDRRVCGDLIYRAHTGGRVMFLRSDIRSLFWSSFWRGSTVWLMTSKAKCISCPLGVSSFAEVCGGIIDSSRWAMLRPYGFLLPLFVSTNTLFSREPIQKLSGEIKVAWFWKLRGLTFLVTEVTN